MRSIRLSEELEHELANLAEYKNVSRSEIIKEALEQYMSRENIKHKPYDLGADVFGKYGSTDTETSTTYKSKIREKLKNKHQNR